MKEKKLQVKTADGWKYVFCRNPLKANPITTECRRKALGVEALEYFRGNFGHHEFRMN